MRPSSLSRSVFVAAVGLIVAACSESSTGPSTPSIPNVSALLAEMAPAAVGDATSLVAPGMGPRLASVGAPDPANCGYSATSGFFECPTVTVNGLTFTREFRLIDAAGNSQSKPDATTSAIETKTTVSGTVTFTIDGSNPSTSTYKVDGSSDMTLSGIRTDKHTLNAVSTTAIDGMLQFGKTVVPIKTKVTQTTTNLVVPNPKAGRQWPSGVITVDVTDAPMVGDGSVPSTSHMQITFDGTSMVTVTMTDGFGTMTCRFDLSKPGAAQQACSA